MRSPKMLNKSMLGLSVACLIAGSAIGQEVEQAQSAEVPGADLVAYKQTTQVMHVAGSQLKHEMLKSVLPGGFVKVQKLRTPEGDIDLDLERISVLDADAEIVVGTKDGLKTLARPDVIILSGVVSGIPDSTAYLAVSAYGVNGFIEINRDLISISTGSYAQGKELTKALKSARMSDVINLDNAPSPCGFIDGDQKLEPFGPMVERAPSSSSRGVPTCRVAGIAIETDWEFTDEFFDGNADAAAAYIVSLMGAISEIYERDLNVRLTIPFLRVWADNSDPYSVEAGDPLEQVLTEWNANMADIDRVVTHYFTGRDDTSYGGVAYRGALCSSSYGYGVSAHLNGAFPYPLESHNGGNWDVVVASHELGHNFGTTHTHSYQPQIDGCGTDDCTLAFGGTIMSYCHTCSGGMSNLVLEFHPRVRDQIIAFMDDSFCDLTGQGITAVPDTRSTLAGVAIEIDAMGNDEGQSCDAFTLSAVDSVSANGGGIEVLAGQGAVGRDIFRYTPANGFDGLDTFNYTIAGDTGSQSTVVTIDVQTLRAADIRTNPAAGLGVEYFELFGLDVLPEFENFTSFAQDVSMGVAYESTLGNFMNSGREDNIAALFEGYVFAQSDGVHTFSINSDDGSKLYIGEDLIINNDGLHGMIRRTGTAPLSQGWHQIRIEFFERGGGAGLIATIQGPNQNEVSLAGDLISHESDEAFCLADLNGDGVLNFFDVAEFLDLFAAQDPIADFSGDGIWNFFDVGDFLNAFGTGCP